MLSITLSNNKNTHHSTQRLSNPRHCKPPVHNEGICTQPGVGIGVGGTEAGGATHRFASQMSVPSQSLFARQRTHTALTHTSAQSLSLLHWSRHLYVLRSHTWLPQSLLFKLKVIQIFIYLFVFNWKTLLKFTNLHNILIVNCIRH